MPILAEKVLQCILPFPERSQDSLTSILPQVQPQQQQQIKQNQDQIISKFETQTLQNLEEHLRTIRVELKKINSSG